MDVSTCCIHGSGKKFDTAGAVSVPIFQTATFAHPGVGESTGYDYSRLQNPTREYLEDTVRNLEQGGDCLAFSTGMAAISTLMELFAPNDHIIAGDDLYGGSHRLFDNISNKNGLHVSYCDTSDLARMKSQIEPATKAIYIETPSNPMMHITDIAAVSALCREHGLLLIVDNTFLTPYLQRPLTLGADVVVHSGTKYLAGHNDTLSGFLVVRETALAERLRFIYKTTGACLSPFDSWLTIRGIKTLAVRMDRQQQNAMALVEWLRHHPKVSKVFYTGLADHPQREVILRQTDGFGAMFSFQTIDEQTARHVLESVRLIQYAESLGGVESLITYPMMQTHADVPEEQRLRKGIDGRLLRFSTGLEAQADLIRDLEQALGD